MPSSTIAIIGTGAVGGCYGAKLHDAGNKVLFHMRGPNYRAGQQHGLTLKSVSGDVFIPPAKLHAYQSTHEMAVAVGVTGFDWVVIALKSTAMDEIADLVDPLLSDKTRLLLLMNGLVEDAVIQRLKTKGCRYHSVYGGAAFVCAERTAPAVIEHRRYGAISAALAESMSSDDDHEASLLNLFKGTSVDLTYETSLLRGRWKKMMVNLSFNGLCVAMGGITVDKIAVNPKLLAMASTIMDEASAIGNAELLAKYGVGNFKPLGVAEKTAMMDWCAGVGEFAPSTLVDFLNGQQMEIRYLFQEPIIRGKRLDISCPVLESVVSQIVALAQSRVAAPLATTSTATARLTLSPWASPRSTNTRLRISDNYCQKAALSSTTLTSIATQSTVTKSPKAKVVSADDYGKGVPFGNMRQNLQTTLFAHLA